MLKNARGRNALISLSFIFIHSSIQLTAFMRQLTPLFRILQVNLLIDLFYKPVSVLQNVASIVRRLVNDKLEMIWKEVAVASRGNISGVKKENHEEPQRSLCSRRYSKPAPPKYKSSALIIYQTAWWKIYPINSGLILLVFLYYENNYYACTLNNKLKRFVSTQVLSNCIWFDLLLLLFGPG
jgi:hypothetical protein